MGTNCEVEVNNCEQQPCANGGTCKVGPGGGASPVTVLVSSVCQPQHYKMCSTEHGILWDCQFPLCLFQTVGEGFECDCPEGYTGRRCDIMGTSCQTNPCLNNGTCLEVNEVHQCKCMEGFTGFYCDVELNECVSHPCQNGGRCIDEVNGFRCICTAEYKGPTCQENIDNCANNPCYNNGTCIDGDNDFTCRCRPGFVGQLCQENVPDCDGHPCANGGTCHDEINDFRCSCANGWEGKDCSINTDECASNPCQNGGVCTDMVGYYECMCISGYYGNNCEYSNGQLPPTATPKPRPAVNTSALVSEGDQGEITMVQLALIVCLGAGIPLLLIILVVIFLLLRKRNAPAERLDTSKEHQQNVVNNINNKLSDSPIFTTSSTISGKLTNEKQNDFNNYSASGSNLNADKSNNKILLNSKDLNIHHEQFSKSPPTSAVEKYNYDPDAARGGGCSSLMKSNNENSSSW